jgi:hypothetical protein
MPEPTSTTGAAGAALVAIAVSVVGSKYGPLVTVVIAAAVGAYISLGEVETPGGRRAGAAYILRFTLLAMFVAGTVSYLIERYTTIPAIEILVVVALGIGWVGNRWKLLLNAAVNAGVAVFGFLAKRAGGGQ